MGSRRGGGNQLINFSALPQRTALGRLLRLPLRWIPPAMSVRILQGPLRGKRWIVGAGDHGYWLGSYEASKQRLLARMIQPGEVVFDVGAHAGYYTLLASVRAGATGRVVAFEPAPSNLSRLKEHLRLNQVANVTIVEAAVSDRSGIATFDPGPSSAMGHFSAQGAWQIRTVSLDELVFAGEIPVPNHIKIDVEGAEMLVLRGAGRLLAEFHPTLYLGTDVGDLHRQCSRLLTDLGYDLQPIEGSSLDQSYEILASRL